MEPDGEEGKGEGGDVDAQLHPGDDHDGEGHEAEDSEGVRHHGRWPFLGLPEQVADLRLGLVVRRARGRGSGGLALHRRRELQVEDGQIPLDRVADDEITDDQPQVVLARLAAELFGFGVDIEVEFVGAVRVLLRDVDDLTPVALGLEEDKGLMDLDFLAAGLVGDGEFDHHLLVVVGLQRLGQLVWVVDLAHLGSGGLIGVDNTDLDVGDPHGPEDLDYEAGCLVTGKRGVGLRGGGRDEKLVEPSGGLRGHHVDLVQGGVRTGGLGLALGHNDSTITHAHGRVDDDTHATEAAAHDVGDPDFDCR